MMKFNLIKTALFALTLILFSITPLAASQTDIAGPAGSGQFGSTVTVLPNGNIVVTDPLYDITTPSVIADVGAVYLYNGATLALISTLTGNTADDQVGSSGIRVLTNGNYVVSSPSWGISDEGAVTWNSGTTGINGVVSSSNSLVGSMIVDRVGNYGIAVLTNGNYVVNSPDWGDINEGAVTWGNGASGTSGVVSSSNSLVGSMMSDNVGNYGITVLTNGNYVIRTPFWGDANEGAVTWGNGTSGTSGVVSASNSLVGSTADDQLGSVTALTNGNYVVGSSNWGSTDVGAVTWGSGTTGISGTISASNSLVGLTANDEVGAVTALTNGNYVVGSTSWGSTNEGAVTWGNGATGISGTISSSNSLVGSTANDYVGSGITALTNGNYVVSSSFWGSTDVGAVTWCDGTTGISGMISSSNSLVGLTGSDLIGLNAVTALSNGNYVVGSSNWDNMSPAVTNASAYTFGNGAGGTSGLITDGTTGGNSVVGTVADGTNTFAFDATRNRLFVGRQTSNIVSVIFFNTTAIADGDLSNAANWDNGVPNGLLTGIIPSGRTMTISSVMNIGQIQVQCGGALTGGSASAYIVGSVRKDFCAASNESFTYPIGDAGNYSPLTISNTNGTGNLTATVVDDFMPGLPQTIISLSRYWSLEGAGITANLTFNYVNADINGTESDYKVYRRPVNNNALVTQHAPSLVDAPNNTITAFNVSRFSDWGVGAQPLAPLAAGVSVSGRVMTANGAGLRNAIVTLTDSNGNSRNVRTGTFGYYSFEDVEAGATYIVAVRSKRFQFNPQVVSVSEDLANLDFYPIE